MSDAVDLLDYDPNRGRLTRYYLRVVAFLLLSAGLVRAAQIMGVGFDAGHFLTFERPWQAAMIVLCILDLLAAVGLWISAVWGPVIWAVAAITEIAMYTLFRDIYGHHQERILAHAALMGLYVAVLLGDRRRRRDE
ncbi:DUF6163 family protein [Afifella sp. JA880]|uniref:DUF6163 family protein n=1 Tax=Afifella sp. JA880 TaxID=2975280 RepID=UPI0021BA9BF9|nr:DUF6163 family protein [Afifella sp. JA880]MCT8265936.1 DUF6163 family protein [Afifella sp. JA880]